MSKVDIQFHAGSVFCDLDVMLVTASRVELSELLSEIPTNKILDELEFSTVLDFVSEKLREAKGE